MRIRESIYSNNDNVGRPTDNAGMSGAVQKIMSKVLIPGFGYGRNARVFHDAGMVVSGIEISPQRPLKEPEVF